MHQGREKKGRRKEEPLSSPFFSPFYRALEKERERELLFPGDLDEDVSFSAIRLRRGFRMKG